MVKVVWRKSALKQLNEHYNYIKLDSFESAHKVREAIFDIAESLASNPERFPIDRYKQSNKGDIRAFEKFKLRVAYQITKREIRILRVRHIKRNPKKY